jgi:hypothetical protein
VNSGEDDAAAVLAHNGHDVFQRIVELLGSSINKSKVWSRASNELSNRSITARYFALAHEYMENHIHELHTWARSAMYRLIDLHQLHALVEAMAEWEQQESPLANVKSSSKKLLKYTREIFVASHITLRDVASYQPLPIRDPDTNEIVEQESSTRDVLLSDLAVQHATVRFLFEEAYVPLYERLRESLQNSKSSMVPLHRALLQQAAERCSAQMELLRREQNHRLGVATNCDLLRGGGSDRASAPLDIANSDTLKTMRLPGYGLQQDDHLEKHMQLTAEVALTLFDAPTWHVLFLQRRDTDTDLAKVLKQWSDMSKNGGFTLSDTLGAWCAFKMLRDDYLPFQDPTSALVLLQLMHSPAFAYAFAKDLQPKEQRQQQNGKIAAPVAAYRQYVGNMLKLLRQHVRGKNNTKVEDPPRVSRLGPLLHALCVYAHDIVVQHLQTDNSANALFARVMQSTRINSSVPSPMFTNKSLLDVRRSAVPFDTPVLASSLIDASALPKAKARVEAVSP